MFNYSLLHKEAQVTVALAGDMDIDVTEILQNELAPELRDKMAVEFDFAQVSFVDSSGIGLLITLVKDLKGNGQKAVIRNLQPDVRQVFDLLQLPLILGNDVFEEL